MTSPRDTGTVLKFAVQLAIAVLYGLKEMFPSEDMELLSHLRF